MTVIYPRFLGVDGSGDYVWELEPRLDVAPGDCIRWTWGDDPHAAATRGRTFEPRVYIAKYGRPAALGEVVDRKAEADEDPDELAKRYAGLSDGVHDDQDHLVALRMVIAVVAGWVEGARENHEAMDHREELSGEECWTRFGVEDIRNMVADAARGLGVPASEFESAEEAE